LRSLKFKLLPINAGVDVNLRSDAALIIRACGKQSLINCFERRPLRAVIVVVALYSIDIDKSRLKILGNISPDGRGGLLTCASIGISVVGTALTAALTENKEARQRAKNKNAVS
jgi:hypothetical protein